MSRFYSQCTSHLTIKSLMNLLVAEDSVSCSWPGLSPLGAGTENNAAVKTLEAVDVVILQLSHEIDQFTRLFMLYLIQGSDPRSLGLTLLWLNGLQTASAHQGEHPETRGSGLRSDTTCGSLSRADLGDSKGGSILMADSSDISGDSTGGGHNWQSNKITLNIKYKMKHFKSMQVSPVWFSLISINRFLIVFSEQS